MCTRRRYWRRPGRNAAVRDIVHRRRAAGRRLRVLATAMPAATAAGLAAAADAITEGEAPQLPRVRNPDFDEPGYLKVIERKPSVLFAAAMWLGALLAAPARLRAGAGLRLPDRRQRA